MFTVLLALDLAVSAPTLAQATTAAIRASVESPGHVVDIVDATGRIAWSYVTSADTGRTTAPTHRVGLIPMALTFDALSDVG